ncbi:MAG: hypothetical protein IMZ71_00205 [Chloroflexi bacterium]|nr:hypothetical protein [Chloroflexota bacterium]
MTDLELVSTEDMLDELARRQDVFVAAGFRIHSADGGPMLFYVQGGSHACYGLLAHAQMLVMRGLMTG